jgi:Matrixin
MKNRTTTAAGMALALIVIGLLLVVPAYSYLPMGTGSGSSFTLDKWQSTPIPVVIGTNIASGAKLYGTGSTTFQTVIQNSLATWNAAPNFQSPLGTVTTNNSYTGPQTGVNLICFCSNTGGVSFTDGGTLAITVTTYSGNQIIGANIFFNPQPSGVCFVTDSSVASCSGAGDPTSSDVIQDLQTVATHEIGHFIGLDHSAVVRSTMFPYAPPKETELSWDDVAGASLLYPKAAPDVTTGAISGVVTLATSPVFGAHVFANSTSTANPLSAFTTIRKSAVGVLTDPLGNYKIQGLPQDSYYVYAEPLDLPETDSNVDWATDYGQSAVQINFTTRFY